MKVAATTIDEFFSAAAGFGHDLPPIDAAIRAAVPRLDRWLFQGASVTMIGYGETPGSLATGDALWPRIGLAPQKHQVSVYVAGEVHGEGIAQHYQGRMGKTNNGVGCIRFRRFDDIDLDVFTRALRDADAWLASHPRR